MISRFLKVKHWQMFILTFGIPMVFQIVMMATLFTMIATQNNPDPRMIINYVMFFPIIMVVVMVFYWGWFYSIGTSLQKKLPETVQMNLRLFKLFFLIPNIYIFSILIYMSWMFSKIMEAEMPNPMIFALIIPIHLFSIFCIIYCLYFIAKSLKAAELQRPVTFNDYIGEFFLIWFYPIGIWLIQPRINKLFFETPAIKDSSILDSDSL